MQNRGLARLKQSREFLPEGYANSEVATTGRRQTAAAVPYAIQKSRAGVERGLRCLTQQSRASSGNCPEHPASLRSPSASFG